MERIAPSLLLLLAALLTACIADSVEDNVSADNFLRRAYHASVVAQNQLYVYGGLLAYTQDSKPQYVPSSSIMSLDLTKDWTPSTTQFKADALPSGVPDLSRAALWYHKSEQQLYTGLIGEPASYDWSNASQLPNEPSVWKFDLARRSWSKVSQVQSSLNGLIRADSASSGQTDDMGFALDGLQANKDGGKGIQSLVSLDMNTSFVTNTSNIRPITLAKPLVWGQLHFVPTWGPQGLLISFGGWTDASGFTSLATLSVFDPDKQAWYSQPTTGQIPVGRRDYCVAGAQSTNGTYEIFFYGGGVVGSQTLASFDTAHILTLPGFNWIQVQYASVQGRQSHTCERANNTNQIVVVGGVFEEYSDRSAKNSSESVRTMFNKPDPWKQGLGIFDLNALAWKDNFSASTPAYEQSTPVKRFYASDAGAYKSSLNPSVAKLLQATRVASPSTATAVIITATTAPPRKPKSNVGAIAGGVIGAIAAVAIASLVVFLAYRRRRKHAMLAKSNPAFIGSSESDITEKDGQKLDEMAETSHWVRELDTYQAYELNGQGVTEADTGEPRALHELNGYQRDK